MDEFEKLANEISSKASDVDCDSETYQEGLETIIEHLKMDLTASRECG